MTGEITLRGRILPIGGLKEKPLRHIAPGYLILYSRRKRKGFGRHSDEIKGKINFIKVKTMDAVT